MSIILIIASIVFPVLLALFGYYIGRTGRKCQAIAEHCRAGASYDRLNDRLEAAQALFAKRLKAERERVEYLSGQIGIKRVNFDNVFYALEREITDNERLRASMRTMKQQPREHGRFK